MCEASTSYGQNERCACARAAFFEIQAYKRVREREKGMRVSGEGTEKFIC